jgi:hypothetical protein
VRIDTFKWWLWRLGNESAAGTKRTKPKSARKQAQRERKKPRLVRVKVDRRSSEAERSHTGPAETVGGWTLKTSKGHVLEVRGPVDDSGLRMVLDALSQKGGLR